MGFTVAHKGGTRGSKYKTYLLELSRRLLKDGVGFDNVPRVREGDDGEAWLYVWDSEAEASEFAKALKKTTRDPGWYVRPVKGRPSLGPLRPLEIDFTQQGDGWVFGLEPLTELAIQLRFPGSCRYRSMFVGTNSRDLAPTQEELRQLSRHVLPILTGLSPEQLRTFESFRIVVPAADLEVLPPTPLA